MSALALHFPDRPQRLRWTLAGFAILLAHAAAAAALVLWYERTPPEEKLMPAIMVSFAPAAPAVPAPADEPIAQQQTEKIDEPPPEPPKVEEPKIEQPPPEEVAPPPPRRAEIALPKPEPKRVERKKPAPEKRPSPRETRPPPPQEKRVAMATPEASRQSSAAASSAYSSLVYGHLQRFKQHRPAAAGNASGRVNVRFVLNRAGNLIAASIVGSSGNAVLDQEALAIVRRANPFPPFPAEKPGAQDSFLGPIDFSK